MTSQTITLCGSAKFEEDFHFWNKILTLAGHAVFGFGAWPSIEGSKTWYSDGEKELLDQVHLLKIEKSDAILVLNKDRYIGKSTRREISWATLKHKNIFYLEPGPYDHGITGSNLLGPSGAKRSHLILLIERFYS